MSRLHLTANNDHHRAALLNAKCNLSPAKTKKKLRKPHSHWLQWLAPAGHTVSAVQWAVVQTSRGCMMCCEVCKKYMYNHTPRPTGTPICSWGIAMLYMRGGVKSVTATVTIDSANSARPPALSHSTQPSHLPGMHRGKAQSPEGPCSSTSPALRPAQPTCSGMLFAVRLPASLGHLAPQQAHWQGSLKGPILNPCDGHKCP